MRVGVDGELADELAVEGVDADVSVGDVDRPRGRCGGRSGSAFCSDSLCRAVRSAAPVATHHKGLSWND